MFHIQQNLKNANVARTIRFPDEMFETMNLLAQQRSVSFNSLVLQCCKYALENLDPQDSACLKAQTDTPKY